MRHVASSRPAKRAGRRHTALSVLCATLTLSLTNLSPSQATTLRMLDLEHLTQQATDIVVGHVESVQARWSADHRTIYTEVRVRVEDRLKGAGAATLALLEPGGEVDSVRVTVDATPVFTPGERAVLFTAGTTDATRHVLGMAQGKFDVTEGAAGTSATVQRTTPGFWFDDLHTLRATAATAESSPAQAISLEAFLAGVRGELAGVRK